MIPRIPKYYAVGGNAHNQGPHHIDFAEAYLVASAETFGLRDIISFDRSIYRVTSVRRIEP